MKIFKNTILSVLTFMMIVLPVYGASTVIYSPIIHGNTTVKGALTVTGAQVQSGAVTLGDAAADAISITGTATATEPINYDVTATITAGTTQTQAGGTLLTAEFNNVTTVGTAGDGVRLPSAVAGMSIKIKNSGANILAVYPFASDSIDALAINLPVRLAPGSTGVFNAKSTVVWESTVDNNLTLNAPTTNTGQLVLEAADSAGNTVTKITNASQAAARTYTIPDAGASASFVMSAGANTLAGTQTVTGSIYKRGFETKAQGAPTAETGAATITIADMLTGIITISHTSGATVALTTDTGTQIDAGVTMSAGDSFDFTIINLSAAALDTATLTAGASGVTLIGRVIIPSAHSTTIQDSSMTYRVRKTATNTFIIYAI